MTLKRNPSWMFFFLLLTTLFLSVFISTVRGQGNTVGNFIVSYGGRIFDSATNQTTFTYIVAGTGSPPDLSHFDVEIPNCPSPLVIVAYSPSDAVTFGTDPTTGINGIKWDLPLLVTDSRTYSVTFQDNVLEGNVLVAVKGGDGFSTTSLPGPSCSVPRIDIEKFISVDGVTWQDADAAPSPLVTPGGQVSFRFVVTNTGNVELTALTLSDNVFDLSACTLPAALPVGAFFECVVGPFIGVDGQHSNVGTGSGTFNGIVVNDTDGANYFGGVPSPTPTPTFTPTPTPQGTPAPTVTPSLTPTPGGTVTPGGLPITIIIEGPVQEINVNIITIYDIDIIVGDDDPILGIIQIGDILHVEGDTDDINGTIIIIAINITIINVDINVDTGEFWRDDGNCSNPPPPWAPAHGWRRRCQNPGGGVIIQPGTGSPFVVPPGCKLTGIGNNNPHIKCSKRTDRDDDD
jgi:hypothetical protein